MIPQIIPHEVCLACRGCCRFAEPDSMWVPALMDEEIESLTAAWVIPPAVISEQKRMRPEPDALGFNGYRCPALHVPDNRCLIYAHRPFDCQLYPFLLCERGGKRVLAYDTQCPYVKAHSHEQLFQEHVGKLYAFLDAPAIRTALARNPHLFQPYPDVVVCAGID